MATHIQPVYNMNPEMQKYYNINQLFLIRIGCWPFQSKVMRMFIPCFFVMVHCSALLTQVILLYDTWLDVDIIVECLVAFVCLLAADTKLINIRLNNDKFGLLLQNMNKHWELFNNEYEHQIMRNYANIGRKITNYFAVYLAAVLILYSLIPLIPRILDIVIPLNESRPLTYIYQAEYRFDKEKYYYLIILHSYITTIITIVTIFTVDTTYVICVLHTCSLFTALSQHLENITGEADTKSDNDEKYTGTHYHLEIFMEKHNSTGNDYYELITCLKKHQLVLEHCTTLDSTFTHATFILLSLNVLILSVIGIQLINNLSQTEEVIRYGFVACVALTHLICICIPGQLLIDRSTEIFDKAYGSAWYSFSIKTRKLLRILLYRSFSPCTLSAGKMFVMSLTMCSTVLQTAMSYFTTFSSLQ